MDSFTKLQIDLSKALKPFLGKKQSAKLERDACKTVAEFFQQKAARKQYIVLQEAGLEVIGCKLFFDVGSINLGKWFTSFYPNDRFAVSTQPNVVPLGYVNGYQLYIEGKSLMARSNFKDCDSWQPNKQGVPASNTVFFVALERARHLGYLNILK